MIAICASLCDMDTCADVSFWAEARQPWRKRFLTRKHGIPSSATFYRLFRALDPKRFAAFFRRRVSQIVPAASPPGPMAIDGKTIRGSAEGAGRPAHIVSAFATDLGIVFGHQPALREKVRAACITKSRADMPRFEHLDSRHGRVVTQLTWTAPATHTAIDLQEWPRCRTIALVASLRPVGGKTRDLEQRYYISSRDSSPVAVAKLSRDTMQPAFTKKKLSKRQKRKFANWNESIMRSILGLHPLWCSSAKALGYYCRKSDVLIRFGGR